MTIFTRENDDPRSPNPDGKVGDRSVPSKTSGTPRPRPEGDQDCTTRTLYVVLLRPSPKEVRDVGATVVPE